MKNSDRESRPVPYCMSQNFRVRTCPSATINIVPGERRRTFLKIVSGARLDEKFRSGISAGAILHVPKLPRTYLPIGYDQHSSRGKASDLPEDCLRRQVG